VVRNTGFLWYTDRNIKFLKLISPTGTEIVQRSDTYAYGVAATSDGGCWYVSGTDLLHLDSDGILLETLEDVGSSSMRDIFMDGDDAFYIRDGEYVKRVLTDGTEVFSTYVAQVSKLLSVTDTGIWVRTSSGLTKFVTSLGELKSTSISYSYLPAAMEYAFDSSGHGYHFPISIDSHWQNLTWREVRPDQYPLPLADEYVQSRITLQANKPSDIYAVSESEVWSPDDTFTQTNGTGPKVHRWVASDDTSSIAVVSNRLRFYGGVGSDKNIKSQGIWYIDTGGTRDIDIQLYYYLPGSWDPPAVDYYLYLRIFSLDTAYLGRFAEAIILRYNNGGVGYQRIYMRVYDGTYHGTYNIFDSTYNYGYIRMHLDRANDRWRGYDYVNSTWVYHEVASASSYPIGNTFYVMVYTTDPGSGYNIDIDSFQFNQNLADAKFYEWKTPQLQNVYLQKSIEIPNVYPNTYKDAYMKLELPDQSLDWVGSHNTNLRAWFERPSNI
jgi:hypothetical protein